MTFPDFINGAFEMLGGLFMLNNCRVLIHDKEHRGISAVSMAFFTAWGIWNLYFYPHLGQFFSFLGGCLMTAANVLYVSLMVHYTRR